jgi:hypothetical protein
MRCAIKEDGFLTDCTVVSEDPSGMGFGKATLELAPLLQYDLRKFPPPPGRMVNIPVLFRRPE